MCYLLGRVLLFATTWTVAHQAPLSMGFSRQEYWSGLPLPSLLPSIQKYITLNFYLTTRLSSFISSNS